MMIIAKRGKATRTSYSTAGRALAESYNKYNRNESKLSPTHALVQNKTKEPMNTPIALMDLALHIYD
jgi:hypothetical protein